jgi:chemotaxis family two-component system response regulator Rcp1
MRVHLNTSVATPRPFEILLVEDCEEDVELTRYAFRGVQAPFALYVATDGADALNFLRKQEPYANAPRPDVILLDLNMPGMDGRELLTELKRDDDLKAIPAIVLTTSSAPDDIQYAFRSQAAGFITKPPELERFSQVIKDFSAYWLSQDAKLPSNPPQS